MYGNQYLTERRNFYHKPVMSLNWDYKINSTTKLSTVVYGSWGRGGGTSGNGVARGNSYTSVLFANPDGSRNYDKIEDWNTGLISLPTAATIPGSASIVEMAPSNCRPP
mgnify:CR=1 FL=1